MIHYFVVSLLFLLSLEGVSAQLQRQTVSVQLAGNNSGLDAVEGKNGFAVLLFFSFVCVYKETFQSLTLTPQPDFQTVNRRCIFSKLILSIDCFLAHLLSMKGNFDVVTC